MNTMILVIIGIVWSALSGAIAWVVKGHRDERQYIHIAATAAQASVDLTDAHKLIARLKTEYDTLQTQHRALIVHTDNLAARIADDDEEIGKLRVMIADPLADKLADALHDSELEMERCVQARDALRLQLAEALKPRKRTKGQPVKAEIAE